MQEKSINIRNIAKNRVVILIGLYFLSVLLRFIIGLFTSANPFIVPDENLYMNLARSIHNEGVVAFHGQPLSYSTLLYSLIISPLFGLPAEMNLFRILQLFSTAVMSLAVFPAFMLAKRFLGDAGTLKRCVLVAAFSVLLPDMIMASRLMTESLA